MSAVTIREVAYGSPEYEQSVDLRYLVLRKPINLTFTPADLANDKDDHHLAAFTTQTDADSTTQHQRLVATLILHPPPASDAHVGQRTIKMRQVAVADTLRGRGVGRQIVTWSEQFARQRGYAVMALHARTTAVGFYLTCGYTCVGAEFVEVGIPHQRMEKKLT